MRHLKKNGNYRVDQLKHLHEIGCFLNFGITNPFLAFRRGVGYNRVTVTTGCPEVCDPTLIGYISVIHGSVTKSFEPHIKQGVGIFLRYVMPL